jgi:hypothetical protein
LRRELACFGKASAGFAAMPGLLRRGLLFGRLRLLIVKRAGEATLGSSTILSDNDLETAIPSIGLGADRPLVASGVNSTKTHISGQSSCPLSSNSKTNQLLTAACRDWTGYVKVNRPNCLIPKSLTLTFNADRIWPIYLLLSAK